MIIKTDVSEVLPYSNNNSLNTQHISPKAQSRQSGEVRTFRTSPSVISVINQEKTLGEALSIALASRTVIQKAMEVSARLKSIATEAINTGTVNNNEVARVLSNINTSIGRYGKQVASPPQAPDTNAENRIDTGKISDNLTGVREIAVNMGENRFSLSSISNVEKNLQTNLNNVNKAIASLTDSADKLYSRFSDAAADPAGSVSNLQTGITNDPLLFLAAQGNIKQEQAHRLLG